jgi:hypothetical protein
MDPTTLPTLALVIWCVSLLSLILVLGFCCPEC